MKMGGKQTKNENADGYLLETPVAQCKHLPIDNMSCNDRIKLDPRSPAGCRTPINLQTISNDSIVQLSCADTHKRDDHEKTLDVLRKRFLKSFTYNINDPRSPSMNLNRTPIVFDDTFEKPLSLDDTFSNLFVESLFPKALNKVEQPEEVSKTGNFKAVNNDKTQKEKMIIDLGETETEKPVLVALQQEFDPRSPSIGVERTPIIFTDAEANETSEDVMLESILASLSLDMNSSGGDISVLSRKSKNENIFSNKTSSQVIPLNKHLDRVRTGNKIFLKSKHHKPMRRTTNRKIYEDQENYLPLTPTFKTRQSDKNFLKNRRTPLSCVRNRNDTHARSRSVEPSIKSIKTRVALTSFDDNLNPTEKNNVRVIRQGSQNSLDLE